MVVVKVVPINLTYCGEDLNWETLAPEFFNIPYTESEKKNPDLSNSNKIDIKSIIEN